MTSDDQFFFDYLASIPHDVRKYSLEVADSLDRQVDHVATLVRDNLSHQSWLPASVRPLPRTLPDARTASESFVDRIQAWALRNRAWSAAVVAFATTTGALYFGSKTLHGKRKKARRAISGARKEIVVVAGSPHEPITRSIAGDLERRGFIVYITVSSEEEQQVVQSENRPDIRSLWMDLTTPSPPSDIHPSLHGIRSLITQPQSPVLGVPPHTCQLSGLIIVPSPHYVTGPVATIPPSVWADTANTRLVSPILTTQLFLPLLTLRNTHSTIMFVYPSISSSLSSPFAGPEVSTARALSGFATSLRREVGLLQQGNVNIVELRLGNIDFGSQYRNGQNLIAGTEVLAWSEQQRALYGSQYLTSIEQRPVASTGPSRVRGSPAKSLHYAVVDALEPPPKNVFGRRTSKKPVIYVGRGARSYSLIGAWIPGGLVGWMLGLQSGQGLTLDSASSSETGWEKV